MCSLLRIQGLGQADPEGTAEKNAEDCDDDAVGLGAVALRVKPRGTFFVVEANHEQTRKRAHTQQYASHGRPCQRLPLALPFFFTRLGRALTLATVS